LAEVLGDPPGRDREGEPASVIRSEPARHWGGG
jgi:hypothetical protein